jgi:quercetin dioxygenase-like cupin family protein
MIKKSPINIEAVKSDKQGFKGMIQHFLWTKDDGCNHFAMRLMEFEAFGHTSYHQHTEEHEFYLLEGVMDIVDGEGKGTRLIAGDTAYIPPNEPHQVKNAGNSTMRLLCTIPILPGGDGKTPAPRADGGDYVTLKRPTQN